MNASPGPVKIARAVVEAWDDFSERAGIPRDEIRQWLKGSMTAPSDDPEYATKAGRESALLALAESLTAERRLRPAAL